MHSFYLQEKGLCHCHFTVPLATCQVELEIA